MKKTTFKIPQMDCSAEEQMIRMKLGEVSEVQQLTFDVANRQMTAYHSGNPDSIKDAIRALNFTPEVISSEDADEVPGGEHKGERKLLVTVLLINLGCFVLELIYGFISDSMGLVADSLDMLADALVYALSLYAVGRLASRKKKIARLSGYFQLGLAVFGFAEVIRRFLGYEDVPAFQIMIIVSLVALAGNAASLILLQRSKSKELHIQASQIFTSNDVIANIGVIIAGVIVYATNSKVPDLVIGSIVFALVARGAFRILKLSK